MSYLPETWRLIATSPARGAWNMAVDEAILEAVGREEVPATLRLYAWEPACLSLGYAQLVSDVDLEGLATHGWDLVRRPTGGRAILHTDELTYAVIAPYSEPRIAGSVLESYQRLSGALLLALRYLNITAEARSQPTLDPSAEATLDAPRPRDPNPICFEVPSSYEIVLAGKKLVGSAQARRKEGVLQHGSLPLYGDLARITQALSLPDEEARHAAAKKLLDHAATVETVLGKTMSWYTAAQAFVLGFEQALDLVLQNDGLTAAELARAAELAEQKYANPEWSNKQR